MTNRIEGTTALVTGANGGLGRALVAELLSRGAARVYATGRSVDALADLAAHDRVEALTLDVTDPASVARAADAAEGVSLLLNNAGTLASYDLLGAEDEALRRDLDTNYFGPLNTVRAFRPSLEATGGAVVNVLTIVSLASMPGIGGYGASKAAAHSLTQALRAQLAPVGVRVHGAFPGPIDTAMIRSFEMDKTSPADVARAILEGVSEGLEDIFPDPMSAQMGAVYQRAPKELERTFGSF